MILPKKIRYQYQLSEFYPKRLPFLFGNQGSKDLFSLKLIQFTHTHTMQKLFSLKSITKNPRKIASQTFPSNPIPLHRTTTDVPPHHHHRFSHYTTSLQPLQKTPTNCLIKILSNPLLLKNTLLKLKPPTNLFKPHGEFGSLFRKHSFQFNQPIRYQNTTW